MSQRLMVLPWLASLPGRITPLAGHTAPPAGAAALPSVSHSPPARSADTGPSAPSPVPTAAPVMIPHESARSRSTRAMLLPYGRIAGRRGPGPRGVILGLIIILADTPAFRLGPRRQTPRWLPQHAHWRRAKTNVQPVGLAGAPGAVGCPPGHVTTPCWAARITPRGRTKTSLPVRAAASSDLHAPARRRTQGPPDLPVPAHALDRHRRDRIALGPAPRPAVSGFPAPRRRGPAGCGAP